MSLNFFWQISQSSFNLPAFLWVCVIIYGLLCLKFDLKPMGEEVLREESTAYENDAKARENEVAMKQEEEYTSTSQSGEQPVVYGM